MNRIELRKIRALEINTKQTIGNGEEMFLYSSIHLVVHSQSIRRRYESVLFQYLPNDKCGRKD